MYIPPGFNTVTPYFFVNDASGFTDFLVRGLAGKEILRSLRPDGLIANVQVEIGSSIVMASEAGGAYPAMPSACYLFVEDVGNAMQTALAAGGTLEMEVADMPYGDRQGGIGDKHGNIWWLTQRLIHQPYSA